MVMHTEKLGLVLVLFAGASQAFGLTTDCGVQSWENCIEPMALGSTSFEFEPLFPDEVDFVFAFDVQTEQELADETIRPGEIQVADAKVAFWLEYSESTLTPSARQESYMAILFSENITGTPGDGNNGCDGVWGSECSNNLIEFIKTRMSTAYNRVSADLNNAIWDLSTPFGDMVENITALGCPAGVFNEPYFVNGPPGSMGGQSVLAYENGDMTKIMGSGNATNPFITGSVDDTPYNKMIERVAVAVLARVPLEGNLFRDKDNLQVDIVCAKAKRVSDAESDTSEDSDDVPDGPSVGIDDSEDAGSLSNKLSMTLAMAAGVLGVVKMLL